MVLNEHLARNVEQWKVLKSVIIHYTPNIYALLFFWTFSFYPFYLMSHEWLFRYQHPGNGASPVLFPLLAFWVVLTSYSTWSCVCCRPSSGFRDLWELHFSVGPSSPLCFFVLLKLKHTSRWLLSMFSMLLFSFPLENACVRK